MNNQIVDIVKQYKEYIISNFKDRNIMSVPKLEKIVITVGIGNIVCKGDKNYDHIVNSLKNITGRSPVLIKAKKSVSNFKLRQGMPVSLMVTLRGGDAVMFLYKMINIVIPRIRDFKGMSTKSFDGNGSYSFGIKDITSFPDISLDSLSKNHGIGITICSSSSEDEDCKTMLTSVGFPFTKNKN